MNYKEKQQKEKTEKRKYSLFFGDTLKHDKTPRKVSPIKCLRKQKNRRALRFLVFMDQIPASRIGHRTARSLRRAGLAIRIGRFHYPTEMGTELEKEL